MKKVIGITAAILLGFTPNAKAATSGTLAGGFTVGYSCSITIPSTAALSASNAAASGTSVLPYSQNGNTTYTLGPLTITKPNGATISGTITVKDKDGNSVVTQSSTSNTATGNLAGNTSGSGLAIFVMAEDVESAFVNGSYVVSSTVTCAEQ